MNQFIAPQDITAEEVWKPIPGYDHIFSVSNRGRVRRDVAAQGSFAGRIFAAPVGRKGYPEIVLRKNGSQRLFCVHQLVALAFLGQRPQGYDVNHIDGIKVNNHLENLEYVTRSENVRHAYKRGLTKPAAGSKHWKSKLTETDVREIRLLALTEPWAEIAKRFAISHANVWMIAKRKTWRHVSEESEDP